MENGEYPEFQSSELTECEDQPGDDLPTDPSSNLQDEPCQFEDRGRFNDELQDRAGPPGQTVAESRMGRKRASRMNKKFLENTESDLDKFLDLLGKYLYEARKKQTNRKRLKISKLLKKTMLEKMAIDENRPVPPVNKRSWKRISIHPYVNFMKEYKKRFPKGISSDIVHAKANIVWKKMARKRKLPFYMQAERAKRKGYSD